MEHLIIYDDYFMTSVFLSQKDYKTDLLYFISDGPMFVVTLVVIW